MEKSFLNNIKFNSYRVTLRFKKSFSFPFFHGQKINSLLTAALNLHPLGDSIIIYPAESGRIFYKEGDLYNFCLTLIPFKEPGIEKIQSALIEFSDYEFFEDQLTGKYNVDEIVNLPDVKIPKLKTTETLTLNFVTPLRMRRQEQEKGKKFFDPDFFDASHFLKLLYYRLLHISQSINYEKPAYPVIEIPECKLLKKTLLWVDVPYSKTLGGVIGSVTFYGSDLDNSWLQLLWLGQFLHAGNNPSFGFGKYFIGSADTDKYTVKPAMTFIDKILAHENLIDAFKAVKANKGMPGTDGLTIEDFEKDLFKNLDTIRKEINSGKYKPSDLLGLLYERGNGKYRALAIPSVKDRIIQRAAAQMLTPSIDHLLEENSFAYRKGLSRASAAKALADAYKDGYRFVIKADIESFFDNVDWQILFDKIDALFHDDSITALLKAWVTLPVIYNNQKMMRSKGLPQGSPVSPLLANLFLDEFDEALQDDFKLVRYADDFVILFKTKELIAEAREQIRKALHKLKLSLKETKTEISSFDAGFHYLGYLFLRSMIIDKPKYKPSYEGNTQLAVRQSFSENKIEPIEKILKDKTADIASLRETIRIKPDKYPLYISDPLSSVFISKNTLVIKNSEPASEASVPLSQISSLVIIGKPRITFPAVVKIKESGLPVYFCSTNGKMYLEIASSPVNYLLWLKQAQLSIDNTFTLNFAREIIKAQLHNNRVIIKRWNVNEDAEAELNHLEQLAAGADNPDTLRGIEGRGTAVMFAAMRMMIPEEWGFGRRNRRPPLDPVNVMLSFGYSILYNHISTALQIEGLNPAIGWYHRTTGTNHHALASDLVEEFRHIVDSIIIYLIKRNLIFLSDFSDGSDFGIPCLMSKDARKKFIENVEKRLQENIGYIHKNEPLSYHQYFHVKAKTIRDLIKNPALTYPAMRIR